MAAMAPGSFTEVKCSFSILKSVEVRTWILCRSYPKTLRFQFFVFDYIIEQVGTQGSKTFEL